MGLIVMILLIPLAVCVAEWIGNYIAAKALVIYMMEKGYAPPDEEETAVYTRRAIRKALRKNICFSLRFWRNR